MVTLSIDTKVTTAKFDGHWVEITNDGLIVLRSESGGMAYTVLTGSPDFWEKLDGAVRSARSVWDTARHKADAIEGEQSL